MLERIDITKSNIENFGKGNESAILDIIKRIESGEDIITYIRTTKRYKKLNVYIYDKTKWRYILTNEYIIN